MIDAVIFDWGGTLTPWKAMDYRAEAAALASTAPPGEAAARTAAVFAANARLWARTREHHVSCTLDEVCAAAGFTADAGALAAYRDFWEPWTITDPEVGPLWSGLRESGVRIGVLSNTIWPREWHRDFFTRDGVLDLLDGDVYTSELPWAKPDARAFRAALAAVGVSDPRRAVYVGDRLFEDVWGPAQIGMRTIFVPHSAIPDEQRGPSEGVPDATVQGLSEIAAVISGWQGDSR